MKSSYIKKLIDQLPALISGALIVLAFPVFDMYLLAWVAFIPLLLSLWKKNPLEAFQTGHATYTRLAWLAAVPAHGLAIADDTGDGWLTTRTERLADQLEYLHAANAALARLGERAQLVAMAATV